MIVPFTDLRLLHNHAREELDKEVSKCINKSSFILDSQVRKFEIRYSKFCQSKYCITTGSGLDALTMLLLAHGIKKGDEVLVPSHTFIASWLSVTHTGATPVPVDIDTDSFNIDYKEIEKKITKSTKAVVVVHLYGQLADIEKIRKICNKFKLFLFEDAAQAHGAKSNSVFIGSHSDGAAFSFYPTKNLGCFGDGGAVITNKKKIKDKISALRNYGSTVKYKSSIIGYNSRLDEIQAAILNVKLKQLNKYIQLRKCVAERYLNEINNSKIKLPYVSDISKHVWHLFVIKSDDRSRLIEYLDKKNIQTVIHYPIPPYRQQCYKKYKYTSKKTDELCKSILSIPIYPFMQKNKISFVIDALNNF